MEAASSVDWPNGFVIYDERDLLAREIIVKTITQSLGKVLCGLNRAVRVVQVETPMLTPTRALAGHEKIGFDLVKSSFQKHGDQVMYLRPETTFGTFAAFRAIFKEEASRKKQLPVVLWQYGKSFRDEQSRPMDELRFKEFYQLEYQLFASADSKADYFGVCVSAAVSAINAIVGESVSLLSVDANNLAHYSKRTTDLNTSGGVEVAAISERTDFDNLMVVEVSVGLDRLTALQKIVR